MYDNLKLFYINVKLWRYFGFIGYANRRKAFAIAAISILTNLFSLNHIYVNWGNFEEVTLTFFMLAVSFNASCRMLTVAFNEQKFTKFMQNIATWYEDAEKYNDVDTLKILNEIGVSSESFSKTTTYISYAASFIGVIRPLLQRKHTFNVSIPGMDVHQSPLYETVYAVQMLSCIPYCLMAYPSFASLFTAWIMFGVGTLRSLHLKIEKLNDIDDLDVMLCEIKKCIKYHNKIIRYRNDLECLVSYLVLVDVSIFGFTFCMICFLITIVKDIALLVNAIGFLTAVLYMLFVLYLHADSFSTESCKIAEAAYNLDWMYTNEKIRKYILIIITRSQKPLEITIGGLYPMTLESFKAILKASYSYFNLLQSFKK